ncbi:SpoIIE family protein phosphatase [Streptomyces cavernicola]|uniref:SpoIIE family protein phosphatase n=1 Tax=Streptomyces cavernicola TaxID=3043613 RepID=A0ABT6S531_9ACTN|nr:SpoIIE family protein phosphatase [Streptomyces sp. B-S-A6]MDI3403202.1 SpoIIE family protein phosphatase [Streptomyces sp. B-S-A6]
MPTVAGQVLALQLVLVVLLVAGAAVALVLQAQHQNTEDAQHRSLGVAEGFANAPGVANAIKRSDATALLQPLAEKARKGSGVDTVIVFDQHGIALTHPDGDRIGKRIVGPETVVRKELAGRTISETFTASLGPSVVSAVPVTSADGTFLGGVSVGITIRHVRDVVYQQLPVLLGATAAALALAAAGTTLVGRRLRRQTHGLGPAEMARMYEHHDAVLHAVREGVLIAGGDGRVLLANDEARRLLDLPPDAEGRHVGGLGLEPDTAELLASGRRATDEVHPAGDLLLAVNVRPTDAHGGPSGSVATIRDTTELRALSGRAEVARERLSLLYDASVRIGATLDVVRTAEELAEVAVPRFADFVTVELLEPVLGGEGPEGSEAMRRVVLVGIRDDQPLTPVGEIIRYSPATPQAHSLEHGHAVLEAELSTAHGWRAPDPERAARLLDHGIHSLLTAPLQARGIVLGVADFWRSERTEPFEQEDVAIAEELTARAAVCIDNARRYTRERTMAETLQRSLLPRELPAQDALDVAHRYLPAAQAGVGGDWFDVIPLPGARVALVVGDVVGHGLHAAVTMGRLRTAVHNFSALDLPPDEILAHLDDLVTRIDEDRTAEDGSAQVTGATCLYAVYDPVDGRCTVARAGHPGPALVRPDGTAEFPDVPVSPPLGLGGEPFETAELVLPADSRLVLFTDGLVEDRERDLDAGMDLLLGTLADVAGGTLEETCQTVFDTVRPPHPHDDIALLTAHTRLLDPSHVAEWDVPADPAALAPVRTACVRQVEAWGLEELSFSTELILSELITNAIRYGSEPVRVRMLRGRSLICEVSDGSVSAPHLRRAGVTEEGGRGLFLVAQFAQRWGTRYLTKGKVIWAEQSLEAGPREVLLPLSVDLDW